MAAVGEIVLCAGIAGLGGGAAGFVAAALVVQVKVLRDRWRRELTKDRVFSWPLVPLCAVIGLLLGAVLTPFSSARHAIAVAALAPAAVVLLLYVVALTAEAFLG